MSNLHLNPTQPKSPQQHPIIAPSEGKQKIYVLSADGSSLFLLDPTKPPSHEEPPPYAATSNVVVDVPERRLRASTISTTGLGLGLGWGDEAGPSRIRPVRPRYHSSTTGGGLLNPRVGEGRSRSRSVQSSPLRRGDELADVDADERTPLLGAVRVREDVSVRREDARPRRGYWRSVICGELQEEEEAGNWAMGWKRFWRPVGKAEYWKAMLHLWLINFPFVSPCIQRAANESNVYPRRCSFGRLC
jgi:hypothetical protein